MGHKDIKLIAVLELLSTDKSLKEVADKHKVSEETLEKWKIIFLSNSDIFFQEDMDNTDYQGFTSSSDIVLKSIEKLNRVRGNNLIDIDTGFKKLNESTGGFSKGELIVVASRPSIGKSSFVLEIAKKAIERDETILFFSFEMKAEQLMLRLLSSKTSIPLKLLEIGNLTDEEWSMLTSKVKTLEDAPLFIDDTPALSIFDLRAKCRRLVAQHNVKIVIVDYLQLMTGGNASKGGGNREQEISMISRNLKALAKELNIPVITLSQLSRSVETRGGIKRPLLSDLRESGAIEQDADIVSFIYRPEYYGLLEWDDEERTPCAGQAEFIVAKHRNGGLENIRMKFTGHLALFSDLEESFGNSFASSMNDNGNVLPDSAQNIDPNQAFGGGDGVPF